MLLFFEAAWQLAIGHLQLSHSSPTVQIENRNVVLEAISSACQLKQAQIPCLVDQSPASRTSKATYDKIVAYLSLPNGFGVFLNSFGQLAKKAFLPKASATAFDLRIFQPGASKSATSQKADEKACKCENNLHMLSLLLAVVLKIAANMASGLQKNLSKVPVS